jgi:transposase-like protein
MGYKHDYVNHSIGGYARGDVHINNCENRASILRQWLSVHRGVSKDNLDTYLSLFQLQRNTNRHREDQNNSRDIKHTNKKCIKSESFYF